MVRTTKAQREASIQNIFADVGADFGYRTVILKLTTRKNFTAKWQRSFDWINFDLSDYVEYAPAEAIRGLARSIFSRISGRGEPYGQEFIDYVMSEWFIAMMQPRFIKRNHAVSDDRLDDIVAGLDVPKGTAFAVTDSKSHDKVTFSVLLRTVLVPKRIIEDSDEDEIRDYIVSKLHDLAYGIEHFGE